MSYGDTPRPAPRVAAMVTASGQSPALGHTASRGAAGPSPLIPTAFYSKGTARAPRPRGQLRERDVGSNADREPGVQALPWYLIGKHDCGGHRLSGSDACQALWGCLSGRPPRSALTGTLGGGTGTGLILQKRKQSLRGHEQETNRIPALFLPSPRSPGSGPAHWPLPLGPEGRRCLWADCRAGRERPALPRRAEGKAKATPAPELPKRRPPGAGCSCPAHGGPSGHRPSPAHSPATASCLACPGCGSHLRGPQNDIQEPVHCSCVCVGTWCFWARQAGGLGLGQGGPSTVPRRGSCLGSQPASPREPDLNCLGASS